MDLDDITDEEYFAHMKTMCNSEGWRILMLELTDQASIIEDIQDINTIESLHFCKGQLNAIGRLLHFQDTLIRAEKAEDDFNESTE